MQETTPAHGDEADCACPGLDPPDIAAARPEKPVPRRALPIRLDRFHARTLLVPAPAATFARTDRRSAPRRVVLLEATLHVGGRQERGQVFDLSRGGARVATAAKAVAGTVVVLELASEGVRLRTTVAGCRNGFLHLAFAGERLNADRVDAMAAWMRLPRTATPA
jgi:hypothetical protein